MTNSRQTFDTAAARCKFDVVEADGQPPKLVGYAVVFNELSSDRGGFRVRILPGSIDFTPSVRALYSHNPDQIIGTTANGTLSMTEDEYGLRVEIVPPVG